jgi:hypothetical protein
MFRQKYGVLNKGELLGIRVKHEDVALSQESYIDNLVMRSGLDNAHTVTTPLTSDAILTKNQCAKTPEEIQDMASNNYRELIDPIHYFALAT